MFLNRTALFSVVTRQPTSKEDAKERSNTVDEERANAGWNVVPVLFQEAAGVILHLYKPGSRHYSYSNIYIVLHDKTCKLTLYFSSPSLSVLPFQRSARQ